MIEPQLPPDEALRLESLAACRILDSGPEQAFDELTALTARLLGAPMAVVSLVDKDRQWFKARVGVEAAETPRCVAFCAHAILEPRQVFVVEDAARDERFRDNPLVTGVLGVRFYAGAPLHDSEGRALGTLAVLDRESRTFDAVQRETLAALARQVSRLLDLRRANIEFAELAEAHANARRELEQREDRLGFANDFLEDARAGATFDELVASCIVRLQRRLPGLSVAFEELAGGTELTVEQSLTPEGSLSTVGARRDFRAAASVIERLRGGGLVLVQDATRDPLCAGCADPVRTLGARAFLRVPLRRGIECVGVLALESPRSRQWSEHEIALLRSAAERLDLLFERARNDADRRAAEEALRASEERWQLALAGNNDGIWDWNVLTSQVWFAPRWKEMLGFAPDELSNELETWSSRVHPEDLPRAMRDIQDHFEGRTELYTNEHRLRAKDGSFRWILDRGKALRDASGRPIRMVGSHTDITAQKEAEFALRESEERFRGLCNHAPMLVWLSNASGAYEWLNEGWLAFTGAELETQLGDGWAEGIHPDDRERCLELWRSACAARREFAAEYRLRHASGVHRWIYAVGRPRYDGQGTLVGFIGCCMEIDQRKRLEQDLAIARDGAVEALRVKSQFIANMSHELRTPLNGVLGSANLLELSELPSEQRGYVAGLRGSAEQLAEIISNVLDFSSLESGRVEFREEEFDLHALLADLDRDAAARAAAKSLDWHGPGVSAVPERVVGDEKRLRQVLGELVDNALEFTERGEVRLRAMQEERDRGGPLLRFEVSDTGPGIAADEQLQLFRSFHQVDASTTRRHGGLGLGLALCRKIVDRLGGQIGLRSALGEGSSFWIRVPLRRRAPSVAEPASALPARVSLTNLPRFDGRALVVEDNALNQRVAARLLERFGIRVDIAADGVLGLEAWEQNEYDLVFMDCHMPRMDGFDAARELRSRECGRRRTPIVALSATTLPEERARCLECGMDGFLSKPFLLPELLVVLERYLRPSVASDAVERVPG